MDDWENFDLAVSRWILKLPPEDLPEAAVAALAAGCDVPSLVRLAVMDDATWSEFPPVVTSVFEERGVALPSHAEAFKMVADDLLRKIDAGELDVRSGTHELYLLCAHVGQMAWNQLAIFSGLDDAFYLADQRIVGTEEQVREDALRAVRDLIARGGILTSANPCLD